MRTVCEREETQRHAEGITPCEVSDKRNRHESSKVDGKVPQRMAATLNQLACVAVRPTIGQASPTTP
jgi:hypothetical protein